MPLYNNVVMLLLFGSCRVRLWILIVFFKKILIIIWKISKLKFKIVLNLVLCDCNNYMLLEWYNTLIVCVYFIFRPYEIIYGYVIVMVDKNTHAITILNPSLSISTWTK